MRWFLGCMILTSAFAAIAVTEAAGVQPSERVFPTTTRAWISVPSTEALKESFNKTQYGQLLLDPVMKPFLDSFRDQFRKSGNERLGKIELTLEDLEQVPGGEMALALIESQPGTLAMVLMVDTTSHEAEAKAVVDGIMERMIARGAKRLLGTPPGVTAFEVAPDTAEKMPKVRRVAFATGPSILLVGDDPITVSQTFSVLATGRKDSLETLESFKAVMKQCKNDNIQTPAHLRWFVDPFSYLTIVQKMNASREKRKGPDYTAILKRQGFDVLKAAGGLVSFDDGIYEVRHRTMVYAPPLPGRESDAIDRFDMAARMLRFPNQEAINPFPWIPQDVSSWSSVEWDMKTAFASAESLIDDVVGEKGVFDDVIASLKEDPDGPQIDVEKDLVERLGTRVTVISDYAEPMGTDSERLLFAIETIDPETVAETVAKSMLTDPDMQKIDIAGHVVWELIDRSHEMPILVVETPGGVIEHEDHAEDKKNKGHHRLREKDERLLPHSAVTVAHGHLLIASHRDFLERVLSTNGGPEALAGVTDFEIANTELTRIMSSPKAMISFSRSEKTIRPTYELLRKGLMPKSKSVTAQLLNVILGDGKEGSVRTQKIDGSLLPEFDMVRRYFGSAGISMQSLPEGWYVSGFGLPKSLEEPEVARSPVTLIER